MKKPYTLDYSIERDTDRLKAVQDILDKLDKNPSPAELEQMGSYILYGKDENGKNAYQRGEMIRDARYGSYKTKDDTLISLDEMLENPLTNEQELRDPRVRDPYVQPRTIIRRPKYDKKTGELIDIGDGDIPGMRELWECIDRNEHWLAVLEGKVAASGGEMIFENSYRLYRLRHALIDMRKHQYYLKDAYKPTIHFLAADHPKRQYVDWNSDSYYWIPREEWERRVSTSYFPISKKIEEYETRNEGKEVKWVVRRHTFNWEDYNHVYALICNYASMRDLLWDKLNTDGHTLFMDLERYTKMANLSEIRQYILDCKLNQYTHIEINEALQAKFGVQYGKTRLYTIINKDIPQAIADAALRHRLLTTTPIQKCKKCPNCGRFYPKTTMFFMVNNNRKEGISKYCKDCERLFRIRRGIQKENDNRKKESHLPKM